jgi:hypothetical protein
MGGCLFLWRHALTLLPSRVLHLHGGLPPGSPICHSGGDVRTSLINRHVDTTLVSLLAVSQPPDLLPGPPPVVGSFPSHPSVARASYDGSHPSCRPYPKGFNIGISLPSSLWIGQPLYKGYSSSSFGFKRQYGPVLPIWYERTSVLSMRCPRAACPLYGGLPPGSPPHHSAGDFHGLPVSSRPYGGIPHADDVPPVVYGSVTHDHPFHGFPHVLASVGPHQGFPGASVRSLAHNDLRLSLALDVTMSLSVSGQALPPHLAPMTEQTGVVPPVAPYSSQAALSQMNRSDDSSSSSYSSTFHHGRGSNSSDYDASVWGPSLADDASSDDDFCLGGDEDGFNYGVAPKDNLPPIGYVPSSHIPSLNHSQVIPTSSLPLTSYAVNQRARSSPTISRKLQSAIRALCKSSIWVSSHAQGLVVAEPGANNHMLPDALAFTSYKKVTNLSICMGIISFVPVLGRGIAVFSLNGKRVLVRNTLHVPGLAIPLYSLCAHLHQPGCGFIRMFEDGFHVYFLSFDLSVNMSSDCHLTFKSLGTSTPLATLHYVQPQCPATLYPLETLTSSLASTLHPAIIKDDEAVIVADISVGVASDAHPSGPLTVSSDMTPASPTTTPPTSLTTTPAMDIGKISGRLDSLTHMVARLLPSQPDRDSANPPTSDVTDQGSDDPASNVPSTTSDSPWLLSTMSRDDVFWLIHHEGTVLPPVCPCDTANSSKKKTHWSAKELHRAMGCRKFKNYKHLLLVSHDGQSMDSGKFPPFLGSFATVPKGNKSKPIDRMLYLYLDEVHVDIAFGDCVLVRGF